MVPNIGFDAKRAFFNRSGLGNYSRTLISSLLKYNPEFNYLLFSPKNNNQDLFPDFTKKSNIFHPEKKLHQVFPSIWRTFYLTECLKNQNIKIYHGLSNELPSNIHNTGIGKIVTIHDLIFLRYPELYPFFDRKAYQLKFKKACSNADIVVAISEATKLDLMDFYKIPEDKIRVAYQSCNPSYFTFVLEMAKQNLVVEKFKLPSDFMLYVGSVEERKNLLTILEAMVLLPVSLRIPLVVVGGKRPAYYKKIIEFISKNQLHDSVLFPEEVNDEELKYLYKLATLFVYPSIFEGFGLPVLEALLMETPVITTNSSSLPEAAGPGSILLSNPKDAQEMSVAMELILTNGQKRMEMTKIGLNWAQKFHPKATSSIVANLYKELL